MTTSLSKTFPCVFYHILPLLVPFSCSLPPTFSLFLLFIRIVLVWHWTLNLELFLSLLYLLSLCFSVDGNKGWKTVWGSSSSRVRLMQWLELCSEPDLLCAGKGAASRSCSEAPAGSVGPGRPFQRSPALAELLLLACRRVLCMRGGQGQGWLSLGRIWVICCILFLSCSDSCHCLAGTESCFLYPQKSLKKIDLSFHSRFVVCHSPDICFHNYTQK